MSGRVVPVVGSTDPWSGGAVTDSAFCVLAGNPSPWTLDGTNTWIVTRPGAARAAVIDPGPDSEQHLDAVVDRADELGVRVEVVLLTHGHVDHSAGARTLAERLGVDVRALDPQHRLGAEGLGGGDTVGFGDWRIDVVGTPGHSADSLCFSLSHDGSILTGDTVLGRGTSVIAWPDGDLGAYLESLAVLRKTAEDAGAQRLLPGHGPTLLDPVGVLDAYLQHRQQRLDEVRDVLATGVSDPTAIVEIVYADVPRAVWPAAEMTVKAQLAYLAK